ncbi:MAG: hypothetical protein AAB451_01255 [Patescibacteria group bacterium]
MITQIVAHGSPAHLDEIVAYIALRDMGELMLPGISTAAFRCLTKEDNVAELAEREDIVLLGTGAAFRKNGNSHRIFDEHIANGDTSQKEECATTLAAKRLGLEEDPAWVRILKYVLHTDKNPPNLTLGLAETVMRLQQQGKNLAFTVSYTETALYASLAGQGEFAKALREIVDNELTEDLVINGETLKIVVVDDKTPLITQAARFFGAAVVVVKSQSGQTQILSTNNLRLDMRDTVRVLRLREQWSRGKTEITDWRILEGEGEIAGILQWFFHKEAGNILNGGRSHPDVLPTRIPINLIVDSLRLGLENKFEPSRSNNCQQGICASTLRNPCPWYRFGLLRCRRIRAEKYKKEEA